MYITKRGRIYLAVIFSMVCWSFSFVWVKVVYVSYKPITTVLFRLIISSVLLFAFGIICKKLDKPDRKGFLNLMLLAFFEPFLYFMGESFGMQYVSSTLGSVIVSTIPLFTPITAWYLYREKLSIRNFIGLLVSFLGVGIVVLNKDFSLQISTAGFMLMFLAVLSAIGYSAVLKKASYQYNPLTVIAYQNFIGIFYFLPFWLIFDVNDFMHTPFNGNAMWAIFKLAVFASSLAFILYTYAIRHLGINKANIFTNTIPVFTAIFAFFILEEELNLRKLIGISVVIGGLFLSQLKSNQETIEQIA
ncbi:MAG: DMT family transporter [Bacteroidota bacterium]|nr:DMT family transporter [Bacteroidota bacterium]MDP4205394.1 DMT family transporter [Bacteroidota bacterium]